MSAYKKWSGYLDMNIIDRLRKKMETDRSEGPSRVAFNPFPASAFPLMNLFHERQVARFRMIQEHVQKVRRIQDEARQLEKVKGLRSELKRLVEGSR